MQALNSPEFELSFPAAEVEELAEEPVDASGACAQADSDRAAAAKTARIARCDFFTDCLLEQTMIQQLGSPCGRFRLSGHKTVTPS
ncbi:hypothetical protein E5345_00580 [Propionibacterium sp. NM47_B9-13]|uniref:Uncharacterized protein n=1 Tax=Cutibacterium modestum HL044PA1 TaxID=765109 RepID=A0ABP2K2S1_9ACTN|nr:hypothetical protein HMPREF9621_01974 [Cutibacterium modestum HL037PA2]EFS91034.1 hypothetical protein HMPREF9607_02873 [Cutibacterium modestum HL044PA1]EFT14734.1 hypothetical protein HMPREF9622_02193 [Cutibacterium modestum HL037PA3]REB73422.1 hypothetical protein CP877_07460 [Cutibacterium modestum]TGY29822.1 hypothetical protein E5345_00580 [Propionibacterium sp. NM47_B9-13]